MKLHTHQLNTMVLLSEQLGLPILEFSYVEGMDAVMADSTASIQVKVDDVTYQISVSGLCTKGTWESYNVER